MEHEEVRALIEAAADGRLDEAGIGDDARAHRSLPGVPPLCAKSVRPRSPPAPQPPIPLPGDLRDSAAEHAIRGHPGAFQERSNDQKHFPHRGMACRGSPICLCHQLGDPQYRPAAAHHRRADRCSRPHTHTGRLTQSQPDGGDDYPACHPQLGVKAAWFSRTPASSCPPNCQKRLDRCCSTPRITRRQPAPKTSPRLPAASSAEVRSRKAPAKALIRFTTCRMASAS